MAPDYIIEEARLNRVTEVVGFAEAAGLRGMFSRLKSKFTDNGIPVYLGEEAATLPLGFDRGDHIPTIT